LYKTIEDALNFETFSEEDIKEKYNIITLESIDYSSDNYNQYMFIIKIKEGENIKIVRFFLLNYFEGKRERM
jgi:hypothetical protein